MKKETLIKIKQDAVDLLETIISIVVVVVLYIVYVPFSIVRGLVSRKLIKEFFSDALYLLDSMRTALRFKKQKNL